MDINLAQENSLKEVILEYIYNGSITCSICYAMQKKHLSDTKEPGRSYFNISFAKLQKIVDEYYGSGKIRMSNNQFKETITVLDYIGVYVDKDTGKETPTNKFTIHYSKARTHVVPTRSN